MAQLSVVGDIRGMGLLQGIEIVRNRETREPFPPEAHIANRVAEDAMEAGVITYPMQGSVDGRRGDHILLAPPFTISSQQIQMIAGALGNALGELESAHRSGAGGSLSQILLGERRFLITRLFRNAAGIAILATLVLAFASFADEIALKGYSPDAAKREMAIERAISLADVPTEIAKFHRYLTAEPHMAGSQRNNELARWVADQWKQQGMEDVTIHEYDVLHSKPREISLEMVAPVEYRASLREAPYEVDPDTKNPAASGAYLGYSASGEVTAPVVYAHSGNPEDYDYSAQQGISVRGKIVLVRYSNPYSYRGFKALTAEREGAAAILIYSDPRKTDTDKEKFFRMGRGVPRTHIQRGAITYDFIQPGDPLTPGWASVPGAKRIPIAEAVSLPKIMGVPLSWHDAEPLMKNMGGPVAPQSWQGGLPFQISLGRRTRASAPESGDGHKHEPYYVTEARIVALNCRINGSCLAIIAMRGCTVASILQRNGFDAGADAKSRRDVEEGVRPKRTLVICSWDGEEYALTGSTEWGEQFADELKKKAVTYLNVDSSASGSMFHGTPVASLATVLVDVTRTLPAPSGQTLYQEWRATRQRAIARDAARRRFGIGRYSNRQRLGPHRVLEFSRHSDRRTGIRRAIRRLSFAV